MEDLVDYEDFEKDDQSWTGGSRKGNMSVTKSRNIGKGPDESLAATPEVSGQIAGDDSEDVPIMGDPSDSVDARMFEMHGPPEANKPQDKIIDEVSKPTVISTNDALVISSTSPIEKGDMAINRELIPEATQEEDLIQEELTVDVNPPESMVVDDGHP